MTAPFQLNMTALFLLFLTLLATITAGTPAVEECPAVDMATSSIPPVSFQLPKAYVRDSPLHVELVHDTLKELERFSADTNTTTNQYRPRYFEGWYYKIDLPHEEGTFVVIPGLYLRKEDPHGFVMILDASGEDREQPTCRYYRFPLDTIVEQSQVDGDHDFVFQLDEQNKFTAHGFTLNLKGDDTNPSVVASAEWGPPLPLPTTRLNPTIMGWFSWLPRGWAQCSHGVVSMDHRITKGQAIIGGTKVVELTDSQGYIEKDWGREFPERYTWIQANDFQRRQSADSTTTIPIAGASFLVSVASIPVKPFEKWWEFTGFLSFLRYPDPTTGTLETVRFATYTGAKVSYTYEMLSQQEHRVVVTMTDSKYTLVATVTGDRDNAATLWGPLPTNPSGGMQPYVREMLNCPVQVVLTRKKDGAVVFNGTALHGGFEIEGHDSEWKGAITEQS